MFVTMDSLIIYFILFFVLFVAGLIFFLRFVFVKKNIGCGLLSLLALIPFVFIIWFLSGFYHQTKREFKRDFEFHTGLPFPRSGKIIEKTYWSGFLDSQCAGVIKMNTKDYEKILNEYQARFGFSSMEKRDKEYKDSSDRYSSTGLLRTQFPADDCAYVAQYLWFHKNRRIIVYKYINY
jgi:hypothetical protein